MKTKLKIFLLIVVCSVFSPRDMYSGNNNPGNNLPDSEEEALLQRMKTAKQNGDIKEMQNYQSRLDEKTGSVTKPGEIYPGSFVHVNEPNTPFNGDNINIVGLSGLNGIRALATATEQRGVNLGRIWVAAAVSNTTDRDTIYYFRSDDGGTSWVTYGYLSLAGSDQVNFDQMDLEIIEDFTGDKYIWTVYGLTAGNGKQFLGYNVLRTPTFLAGAFAFTWPGENFSTIGLRYFKPRITSDNPRYGNTASIYIVCSFDSLRQANSYFGRLKYAKCVNPYSLTPNITYIPPLNVIAITNNTPSDVQGDIAYINNGGDSLLVVTSNHYLAPEIIVAETYNTNFSLGQQRLFDNGNTFNKEFARIATAGGANLPGAMIVYRENYQNSGDWDIKGYKSTNGGISWSNVNFDIRRDNVVIPFVPDISAVRNRDGRFNISFTVSGLGSYDTVKYIYTSSGSTGFFTRTVNHLSGDNRPKPGVRLVNNDSCFSIWTQKGNNSGSNIWASGGCNGPISIGIKNISGEIPNSFKLEQNYPNPFNPITKIRFNIPPLEGARGRIVKLVIFDILGRKVEILINEQLKPGIYEVDFDADGLSSGVYFYALITNDFSEIKRMMLIK